jgi:hypothetical protein
LKDNHVARLNKNVFTRIGQGEVQVHLDGDLAVVCSAAKHGHPSDDPAGHDDSMTDRCEASICVSTHRRYGNL